MPATPSEWQVVKLTLPPQALRTTFTKQEGSPTCFSK